MLREYCDRCKKEIDCDDPKDKSTVEIKISSKRSYSDTYAKFTLCRNCYKELGIEENTDRVRGGEYQEKDAGAAEKLMDVIREMVSKCMEEKE